MECAPLWPSATGSTVTEPGVTTRPEPSEQVTDQVPSMLSVEMQVGPTGPSSPSAPSEMTTLVPSVQASVLEPSPLSR